MWHQMSFQGKLMITLRNGGHVIMQFKSGFSDENSMVSPVLAPGPLREACGFYYQEFSNIKTLPLKENPFDVDENSATDWMEFIIPETARTAGLLRSSLFLRIPCGNPQ